MANTLKFGNGVWATKKGSTLAYNDESGNFKPLPFTTTRSTSATRVNKEGLIEVVSNDVPRVDYTDSEDGVFLLEKAATNLVTYSDDFSQSAWVKTPSLVTVTSNQFISPNGTQNADRLQIQATSSLSLCYHLVAHVVSQKITVSAWVKSNTNSIEKIKLFGDYGTVNAVSDEFLVTDTWKRIEFTFTPTATGNRNVGFYNVSNLATDIQIYGFQAEQNSVASSYIPTQGAVATRSDETASGSGNSEVINSIEGVLFLETKGFVDVPSSSGYIQLSKSGEASFNNSLTIQHRNNGYLRVYVNGVDTASIQFNENIDFTKNHKIAILYKLNGYKLFIDGVSQSLFGTPTQTVFSGLDNLSFDLRGDLSWNGSIKEIAYYDTALTDIELETLTSYKSWESMVKELNLNIIHNE